MPNTQSENEEEDDEHVYDSLSESGEEYDWSDLESEEEDEEL